MNLTGKPVRAGVVFDKINRMTPANAIGFHNLPTARHCSGVCHLINEITPMQTLTGVFITPGWDNNITKTGTSYRKNGSRTITENRNGFFDTKVVA
jgi:hypothetical protein